MQLTSGAATGFIQQPITSENQLSDAALLRSEMETGDGNEIDPQGQQGELEVAKESGKRKVRVKGTKS